MSISKMSNNLNIVQSLADVPSMSAAALKAKFDEGPNAIKTYINQILTDEIDTLIENLNTAIAAKLDRTGGGTIVGRLTTQGGIVVNSAGTAAGVEMYGDTPYIDFHYNNSTNDYTNRIISIRNRSGTYATGNQLHLISASFFGSTSESSDSLYIGFYGSGSTSIMGVKSAGISVRDIADVNTYRPIIAGAFTTASSKRYKENVQDMAEEEADKILDIEIVKFDYKNKVNGVNVAGVIAEDVYKILPNVVTMAEVDGERVPDGVDYSKFVPYLIKKLQIQEKRIEKLEEMIAERS